MNAQNLVLVHAREENVRIQLLSASVGQVRVRPTLSILSCIGRVDEREKTPAPPGARYG